MVESRGRCDDESPPASRPRGRPRDPEVERGILTAALDVFADGGFEKFSVESVATRAGVAKASIYRRFPSRVDLIVAMCQTYAPVAAPAIDTGSLAGDLVELIGFLTETFDPTTEAGRLLPPMLSAAKEYTEVREAVNRLARSRRRRIHDIAERAVDRGELPPTADADLLGDIVVGSVLYRVVIRNSPVDEGFVDGLVACISGHMPAWTPTEGDQAAT